MLFLPSAAEPLFLKFSIAFTRPTYQRILPLLIGAILTRGTRTTTSILRTMRGFAPGHCSSYHRVFSRAAWSPWPLGKILATAILRWIPNDEPVLVPMDDTTAQHRGAKVYGKGCHHDAVRSSHAHVVWRWGHYASGRIFLYDGHHVAAGESYSLFYRPLADRNDVPGSAGASGLRDAATTRCQECSADGPVCLLGLFSVVSLIFAEHARHHRVTPAATEWYAKNKVTFSDAITEVRRLFWAKTIFEIPSHNEAVRKIPLRLRSLLLYQLCRAA